MKDELRSEQRQYEHLIQQGHTILDKTEPDSADAELVSERLDGVNATWDRLAGQLGEREASLNDLLDAGTQFQDTLRALVDWLPLATDSVDALAAMTPAEQRQQLKVLAEARRSSYSRPIAQILLCDYIFIVS